MQKDCLFCNYKQFTLVAENELSYAIRDKFPVTELHTLVVTKDHYATVFDLPPIVLENIFSLAKECRAAILELDNLVKGFNFGSNSGEVADQKIHHVHFHLIPRHEGDIEPPAAR
jgi:diadenosine tetraphosphate (Ap4A) HIT family hydrolase